MVYLIKHIVLTGSSNKIYFFLINSLSYTTNQLYCVTFFILLLFCHFTLVLSKVFDYNLFPELFLRVISQPVQFRFPFFLVIQVIGIFVIFFLPSNQMRRITSSTSRRGCRRSQQIESLAFSNPNRRDEHFRRRQWFTSTSCDRLPSLLQHRPRLQQRSRRRRRRP